MMVEDESKKDLEGSGSDLIVTHEDIRRGLISLWPNKKVRKVVVVRRGQIR
jgi:hypothetical protein